MKEKVGPGRDELTRQVIGAAIGHTPPAGSTETSGILHAISRARRAPP
ncbi:hypothetical protein [Sorangium cellulosum]|nr:hypothetical protein [Sorangium cellulosum]